MNQDADQTPSNTPAATLPRRSRRWLRRVVVTLLLGIPTVWLFHRWAWPPLRVSPETTVITSPLLPDGRPDYVAYLNQKYSEGVTPENNAAVLLVRVAGSSAISANVREAYFRKLGVSDCGDGDAWIEWRKFAEENAIPKQRSNEVNFKLLSRPEAIDPTVSPDIIQYIAANQSSLDFLVQASRRSVFYSPVVGNPNHPIDFASDRVTDLYRAVRLLKLRSHWAIAIGDVDQALTGIVAGLRIGRLMQTQPTNLSFLLGRSLESESLSVLSRLLSTKPLSAEQGEMLRKEFEALPKPARMRELISGHMLWGHLDLAIAMTTSQGTEAPDHTIQIRPLKLAWGTNINPLLISINHDHEEFAAICDLMDLRERQRQTLEWEAKLEEEDVRLREHFRFQKFIYEKLEWEVPLVVTQQGNREFFAPEPQYAVHDNGLITRRELTKLALRISKFQEKQGSLPASLEELGMAPEAPLLDPWSGQPFRYVVRNGAFTLWSVGPDEKDDGGRESSDGQGNDADDIRFGLKPVEPKDQDPFPSLIE